ncbi:MAG: hypothetical protein KDB23_30555, partial [Planctomycetales bacterium]|nr:hypothetical protein [Planctomycetales bacterium]
MIDSEMFSRVLTVSVAVRARLHPQTAKHWCRQATKVEPSRGAVPFGHFAKPSMKTIDLYLFLTAFTWIVACAAIAELMWKRRVKFFFPAIVAVSLVVVNTIVGGHVEP